MEQSKYDGNYGYSGDAGNATTKLMVRSDHTERLQVKAASMWQNSPKDKSNNPFTIATKN